MARVAMIIAPDQFRDEEYAEPKSVLESHGHDVVTVSVAPGPCRGKLGMMTQADAALRDLDPAHYDAVVFIGGGGASVFFDDADAHALVRAAMDAGRVVGAICIAPSTLARADVLDGGRATCFPTQEDDLAEHGATYTGAPVEVWGNVVTANGPQAAHEFGERIAQMLDV